MRILIVDADPSWRDLLTRIVSSSAPTEIEVVSATNGKDALDILPTVQAVVCDHLIPGPSGDEIRRRACARGLPAVLISSVTPLSIAGRQAYVPKDADLIRSAVDQMFSGFRPWGKIKAAARRKMALVG